MRVADSIAFHYANNNTLNTSDVQIVKEQDALYDVPVGLIVLLSVFYGTISILAVIGNSLVIWIVVTTKQMQTITNMFIANLALADVTIGMFAIPFQFQAALLQRWNLPDFMCPFCPFVQLLSVNVSVFTLTAIAVDRHRAIINPLRARTSKNISKFVISAIWILSFALAAPTIFALRVIPVSMVALGDTNDTYINITKPFCQVVNFEESEMLLYRYILTLVQYFVPLCVISFVYIQMAFRLWGSKTPGNAQDSRDMTMLKNKKKVIKMLIIVVALFAICWFPLQLYNILNVTWSEVNEYRYINIIWFVCDWLAMSNSCYNPFIYGIYNEKFKREFRKRYPFRGRSQHGYHHEQSTDKNLSMFTRVSSIRSSYATSSIRNKFSTRPLPATGGGFGMGYGGVGGGGGYYQNHCHEQLQQAPPPQRHPQQQYKSSTSDGRNGSEQRKTNSTFWEPKGCSCQLQCRKALAKASAEPNGLFSQEIFTSAISDQVDQSLIPHHSDEDGSEEQLKLKLNHPHPDTTDDQRESDDSLLPTLVHLARRKDKSHLHCDSLQSHHHHQFN
ncbi:substance-K receptor-like [Wyeomyia smithii]|uniref:substance-K receptor-like n=1 Tax=Wyeomyia smithii TaxID=174621 RepID=UPI002468147B|nr:substance-K receptor-like [Wyeomyia smithii]XP_055532321.1 substance-K receptor-like [Wyeomyia smithii]